MSDDMRRMVRERLELALQALEHGDVCRCSRLAHSVVECIAAGYKPPPPEIADWPTWPQNPVIDFRSQGHGA